MHDTQVAIIGGSLVGLSAAAFLAWRGVKVTVIEKHEGSSPHPRAVGFTQRTLEAYRAIGIAGEIPVAPPGFRLRRATVDSLSGAAVAETDWTPPAKAAPTTAERELSPAGMAGIAQDRLEPILRRRAQELGVDLRLGTEMLSFEEGDDGVTIRLRERSKGREYSLSAAYMIAADGADSPVREALGIARQGVGHLMTIRTVLFHCPAADRFLESGIRQFEIRQDGFEVFLTTYGDGRWVLMFYGGEPKPAQDYAPDIAHALGADLPFEIITAGTWEMAGRIADSYSKGRIFIAGDAAHQLPPTRGGFGANTGIGDVWNLSWKLQFVLAGISSSALLDSYSQERQPIGWLRHQQTFARPDYAKYVGDALAGETLYGDAAMELAQLHRSDIVIGADDSLPPAAHPDIWAGQPGIRAPHLPIQKDGRDMSTIDLFRTGFTLLTEAPDWAEAAREVADTIGVPLSAIVVGRDVIVPGEVSFATAYGTGSAGASLVRPDGIVAWRTDGRPGEDSMELSAVLCQVAAAL
ncbi:MAG: 2,4-dichlorophenol 6-monooxygenase [Rhodobacteraceae bacterium]|nr:MAG: 2,4-dichlorophenol 6-monooxygenase [Paracoccaceae bacterium]